MSSIDKVDVKGNLETIKNLSELGMLMIDQDRLNFIPTLLEDILEHSQRLALEYASTEE